MVGRTMAIYKVERTSRHVGSQRRVPAGPVVFDNRSPSPPSVASMVSKSFLPAVVSLGNLMRLRQAGFGFGA